MPTILHAPCDYLSRMNKHSTKIEQLLGPKEPLSAHEAECLAQRIHTEKLQEFTGKQLTDLLSSKQLPSILLKKSMQNNDRQQQLAKTKLPKLPSKIKTIKTRNITAPQLEDRSLITSDSPFKLFKYQKVARSNLKKEISEKQQQLQKLQKQLFRIDHGNKPKSIQQSNTLAINTVEKASTVRKSTRISKPPNRYDPSTATKRQKPLQEIVTHQQTPLDIPKIQNTTTSSKSHPVPSKIILRTMVPVHLITPKFQVKMQYLLPLGLPNLSRFHYHQS